MTTKNIAKVADRYAALAAIAQTLDGVAFTPAKKPTTKDCEELSATIDAHRAALAVNVAFDESDDVEPEAVDVFTHAAVAVAAPTPVEDRAAAIEAKRAEARRRFETATKATTAHGYALIAAATADGDRMENLRAKLAEMPEAVRAGACRLAAEKLVQPGSTMQRDLRALYDEQPIATKQTSERGVQDRNEWTVKVHKRFAYVRLHRDMKSDKVTIKKMVVDGRVALVVFPI